MTGHAPVFDFTPYGIPVSVYNDERFDHVMETALSAGKPAPEAFDLMTDTDVRLLRTDPEFGSALRDVYRKAGVNLVSTTIMSLQTTLDPTTLSVPEGVRRDLARWQARFDALEWLRKVTTPEDARRVVEDGHVGVIPNTQNLGAAIDGDVGEIERLYDFGLRIAQLTYNSQNLIGAGCTDRVDGGLSTHGVEAVRTCNDLGMAIDLSHCGPRTTLDAIECSDDPVAFTHTFCRSIADHDRGKSDDALEALAAADGYVGIQVTPPFIAPGRVEDAWEVFFDHIDHAVSILGIDRVGIGTDWGVIPCLDVPDPLRRGFEERFANRGFDTEHGSNVGVPFGRMRTFTDWQQIPDGLADHGYSETEIEKLVGRNFLAFWERVDPT